MEYSGKLNKVTLEIPPHLIYTDASDTIKQLLSSNYVNKGFRNCWIKSIDTFTALSDIRIPVYSTRGAGLRDVEFKATVLVYEPGTILTGCAISQNNMQQVTLHKDNLSIFVPANTQLQKLNTGQHINVIVRNAIYKDFQPTVTISADAYFVLKSGDDRIYTITTGLTLDEIEQLQALEARIAGLQSRLANEKNQAFMRDLFPASRIDDTMSIHELIDNNEFEGGLCAHRPNNIDHFSDSLVIYKAGSVKPVLSDTAFFILRAGLLDQLNHTQMLLEMCSYNVEDNAKLWELYKFANKARATA